MASQRLLQASQVLSVPMILAGIAIVFVNVFAAVYAIQRKFFLKDTGRKLSHIDKQVVAGHSPVPPPTTEETP